jgi:hypothetical protein
LLGLLAKDGDEQVRMAVAANLKTSSELLELLSREGIDY